MIPKIVGVVEDPQHVRGEKIFVFPDNCPVCGSEVVRDEGEADYRCVNVDCPARLKESVLHFASRKVMNIEGLGEALVTQLMERQMLTSVAGIYSWTKSSCRSWNVSGKRALNRCLGRSRTQRKRR